MFNFLRVGELKKSPLEGGSSKAAGDVLFAALRRRAINPLPPNPLLVEGLACPTTFLLDTGGSEMVDCPRESLRARV